MNEMEITKLLKELRKIEDLAELEDLDGLDERSGRIKEELGSWFIEGCQLYQAS